MKFWGYRTYVRATLGRTIVPTFYYIGSETRHIENFELSICSATLAAGFREVLTGGL